MENKTESTPDNELPIAYPDPGDGRPHLMGITTTDILNKSIANVIVKAHGPELKKLIPGCTFYWARIKGYVHLIIESSDKSELYATENGLGVYKLVGDGVEPLREIMQPL